MRSFFVFVLLCLSAPALAQGGPPGVVPPDEGPPTLDDLGESVLPEADREEGARPAIAPEDDAARELDALFERLRTASDPAEAKPVVADIQRRWMRSGSATVDLLMTRAGTAMQGRDLGLALDLLDMVTRLAPDYPEGWNRRATVLYLKEDFGRALVDIERVLALQPRHWGAMSGLAIILRRVGRDEDAIAAFHEVLKIHPMSEHARKSLETLAAESAGSPT